VFFARFSNWLRRGQPWPDHPLDDLAAQVYARATEGAARNALVAGATAGGTVAGTTLPQWVTAITGAAATIQANGFMADSVFADPTTASRLGAAAFGVAPDATSVAGMRVVSSNGLTAGGPVAVVGYSQVLLCGETPGAPIQFSVVEPAIGGFEVGVIGAFAAAVADAGPFIKLTPPSVLPPAWSSGG
jgi:hypothetical protein